ncbi:MAG: hypothetical protein ACRDTJ_04340 [Pseudonocardiaceae bacterium]
MDIYVVGPIVLIAVIIGACLWADWLKQAPKRRYQRDMDQWRRDTAQWEQNQYLRQIAEQGQQQPRQDSST